MRERNFLFALEGQELRETMKSGATSLEWGEIGRQQQERERCENQKKRSKKRQRKKKQKLSLLIDAENIGAKKASDILQKARNYGELNLACIYARQKDNATKGWHDQAIQLGMSEKRLYGGPEKDKIDKKIKRDIQGLLAKDQTDVYVIASSDGGYREDVVRLRQLGKKVIVIGESKTPEKLKSAASKFVEI